MPNWKEKQRGLIFNIQRFSIHNSPGIRTTIFMQGCSLRVKTAGIDIYCKKLISEVP